MFDPDRGYPSVVPFLRYRDTGAALRWLCDVLGFVEAVCWTAEDGSIGHAELVHGRCVLQLGYAPELAALDPAAARAMTLVFVDDVDATCARAVAAGGSIVSSAAD